MTTSKYWLDERMGVAQLVHLGKKTIVERDTLPRAGTEVRPLRAAVRLQLVSFQFPIQYALFFRPYLLWCFSNYNKFAFF